VKKYAARLARWAIRKSGATVIADSRYIAGPIEKAAASKLHVVYNGVPEIPFRAHEFGRDGAWRIGLIGRIAPEKGQTDFLRAAERVLHTLPGAKFVICGAPLFSPPSYLEEVNSLAATLPCELMGWRDDVGAVLDGLDLLVVPSDHLEATTRVILEAYSAGVPVVAYANGGIPEVVEDGVPDSWCARARLRRWRRKSWRFPRWIWQRSRGRDAQRGSERTTWSATARRCSILSAEPPLEAVPKRRNQHTRVMGRAVCDERGLAHVLPHAACESEAIVGYEDRIDLTGRRERS